MWEGGREGEALERNGRKRHKDDLGLLCGLHIHSQAFSTKPGKLWSTTHIILPGAKHSAGLQLKTLTFQLFLLKLK